MLLIKIVRIQTGMLWLTGSQPFFLPRHDILIGHVPLRMQARGTQGYHQVPETESCSFFLLSLSSAE